jgi:hypothetical protein
MTLLPPSCVAETPQHLLRKRSPESQLLPVYVLFFVRQMQTAMNQAATRAITCFFFSPAAPANVSAFLELHVSRENLVDDTIRELAKFQSTDLKKPLKV